MFRRVLDWLWDLQGLTCREVTRLGANAIDRPLTFRERVKLSMHGLLCSYCRNYMRQLRFVRKWVRRMSAPDASPSSTELPTVFASRIKKTLEREISRESSFDSDDH
jgi:hypothetical protein